MQYVLYVANCFEHQYNTIRLSFDIALLTLKLRSALVHASADAVVLQINCVLRRTWSRSLHSNYLGRGSNPYSPRYRSSTLTNRPPCYTAFLMKLLFT